jgi:hypothetical protein
MKFLRCMDDRTHVHLYSPDNTLITLCGLNCSEFMLTNKNTTCETCLDVQEHQAFERSLVRERYGVTVAGLR